MKKVTLRGFAIMAVTSLILTARAQDADQSQFPIITLQPVDACILMGSTATFSVDATNADGVQWYRDNTVLDGQTNKALIIPNISTNDVGYYSASVINGSEAVPTRLACLNVYIVSAPKLNELGLTAKAGRFGAQTMSSFDLGGGGEITVFGLPVVSNGGSAGCPGLYAGYVNYMKPVSQGWGFAPSTGTTVHTAADANRSDTKIQYGGQAMDSNCAQTSVTVPDPAPSPKYRFTIFFPRGSQVPTSSYPITLSGFDQ